MEIVFIRHGEPDYKPCYDRGFIGHGRDLAALSDIGIAQAEAVSKNVLLNGSCLIISSPYTRALQTAAIISKNTMLNIAVEVDLHEFLPDKTFQYKGQAESDQLHNDFLNCFGEYPVGEMHKWETVTEIKQRVKVVADKYLNLGYQKIIVVTHGGVIRRFTGLAEVNYCEPYSVLYTDLFSLYGWV
jgi:Fructose-2,6-bisphosphatase